MTALHIATGSIVVAAWVIAMGDGILTGDYNALNLATPVMLIVAGYLFGDAIIRRRYNGNGNGNGHR